MYVGSRQSECPSTCELSHSCTASTWLTSVAMGSRCHCRRVLVSVTVSHVVMYGPRVSGCQCVQCGSRWGTVHRGRAAPASMAWNGGDIPPSTDVHTCERTQ